MGMGKRKRWWLPELAGIGLLLIALVVIFLGGQSNHFALYFEDTFITTSAPIDRCSSRHPETPHDKLLGGLLSPDIDEQSCFSRYKSSMFRKPSPFSVSPYLVEKLRKYEELHKKCGPKSDLYKRAIDQLNSGQNTDNAECKYVIWTQINGLGNRMLSLASTFLYSLLTNRVLLVELTTEMRDVFCEPFPGSSWQLPPDFPIKNLLLKYGTDSPESYTVMLKNKTIPGDSNIRPESLPSLVFFNAVAFNWRMENHLFCEDDQKILQKFNWMVVKSDGYYAAALFLLPAYRNELRRLFPVKESVFHHLGRYLFQPANPVWNIIERFYRTHLINSDEKVGLQIRQFREEPIPFEDVYNRIIECSETENLLPKLDQLNHDNSTPIIDKRISVLVLSLSSEFYDMIKAMYYEKSTVSGEMVAVYQPTHEREQDSQAKFHNQKAFAEMFLLSYCDKIITTATSTFGYVAHGLAGSKPWVLRTLNRLMKEPGPACVRSMSVEPCLHSPPIIECKENVRIDPTEVEPYLRQCDDAPPMGLKLYDLV
ncbi:fucosyltransferase 2 [Rhynchospora pubera]|uniref:Fucosyltransferase n=1 Tax=Rhynchospora pubera TaxID=906938 RepID=A0AAV8FLL0_9POAL|nr:fucosyltransferase 2 [Rhynchospora pubera]